MARKELLSCKMYLTLIVSAVIIPQLFGANIDGREVLDQLRSYDQAFLQSMTLTLESNSRVDWVRADEIKKTKTVLTSDGSTIAWSTAIFYASKPTYKKKTPATAIDYDANDNYILWDITQSDGLIENDFQGRRKKMVVLQISPEGDISEGEGAPLVEFRQPKDSTKFLDYKRVILSSGRGFADLLGRIIEVNKKDSGLINIKAGGSFGPKLPEGIWNITLDPEAGYLVRSASFNVAKRESPFFVFTSNGTKWFGGVSLAERSSFFIGDNTNIFTTKTEQFKPEIDEELLSKLRNNLRGELPRNTEVSDYRSNPNIPLRFRVGKSPMTDKELLDVVYSSTQTDSTVPESQKSGSDEQGIAERETPLLSKVHKKMATEQNLGQDTIQLKSEGTNRFSVFWLVTIIVLFVLFGGVYAGKAFRKKNAVSNKQMLFLLVVGLFIFSIRTSLANNADKSIDKALGLSSKQLCGPLSLHTAASMLGVQLDLHEIAKACKPTEKGTSMAAIKRVAESFGLTAKGYKLTWEKLKGLDSPAILYINQNHFVSVNPNQYTQDESSDKIRVFDSDKTPEWWSRDKIEEVWSGESLVIDEIPRRKRTKGAKIKFHSLTHDLCFVQVPLEKKLNKTLSFTNVGKKVLNIGRIKASCGCTKVGISSAVIEPGQSGTIDLAVNLDKIRGPFEHWVIVETNDEITPITKIRVTGRTYNTQIVTRKELNFGAISRGNHRLKSFVLHDPGDGSLKCEGVNLEIVPATVANEKGNIYIETACFPYKESVHRQLIATKNDIVLEIKATVSEKAPIADFKGNLKIYTTVPSNEYVQIPISGTVISDITATPAALFLSNAGEGVTIKEVKIDSNIGRQIQIKDVRVSSELSLKIVKQQEDNNAMILTVEFLPSRKEGKTIARGDITCFLADGSILKVPIIIH